ncbi:MAG: ABC transporter permease [Verrucomicrobia bacterium]|nr:ABC transporter permease [Verrucomicrobiota bacterium]
MSVSTWNWRRLSRELAPLLLLALLILLVGALNRSFLSWDTLIVLFADTATLFVLAAGVAFVIILGGIDLSIQSVASLASVLIALQLPAMGRWAFPITFAFGLLAGAISGLVHVGLRIPSFIATLATSGVFSAAALVLAQGHSITIGQQGRDLFVWVTGRWGDIPNVAIIGVVVALICAAIQRYTHFGRYSLAIGAGEQAALASGIPVDRFKVFAFALSGGLASLAGMLLAGRLSSGSPTLANELLLPAIAAVVVGGTAITGGSGGVLRTALGALIISVVRIGMTFLGVNIFAQQIVFGIVLILAVAITMDRIRVLVVK